MGKEVPSNQQILSQAGQRFVDLAAAQFKPGHKFTPQELNDLWRQAGIPAEVEIPTYKSRILGGKRQRSGSRDSE